MPSIFADPWWVVVANEWPVDTVLLGAFAGLLFTVVRHLIRGEG